VKDPQIGRLRGEDFGCRTKELPPCANIMKKAPNSNELGAFCRFKLEIR
jgi:hypothetical protein